MTTTPDSSPLLGAWKFVSATRTDPQTGAVTPGPEPQPYGYLIFLPDRMFAFISIKAPPPGSQDGPPRKPFIMAYSGPFTVAEGSFTTSVDMTSIDGWLGTEQKRFYKLDGDTLDVVPAAQDGSPMRGRLLWRREKWPPPFAALG